MKVQQERDFEKFKLFEQLQEGMFVIWYYNSD